MKKVFKLLISLAITLFFTSCKNPKPSSDSKKVEESSIIPISYSSSLEESNDSNIENSSEDTHSSNIEAYYHVKFVNYDDTLLYEVDVLEGKDAEYKGETPIKPEDDEFTYEFTGWDKELTNIISDITAQAVFEAVAKEPWGSIIWF